MGIPSEELFLRITKSGIHVPNILQAAPSDRAVIISVNQSYLLHGAESFLRNRQSLSYSKISKYFMEPEGS
jgi:hypothetical protein